ncbi:MAG: glycine oxidase ThiO [Planctomycetaceae bacterium]|nr:glycine oxidase ThiO [Planctomycetaceae bacterium]
MHDVLIIGGGVIGLSIAYEAAGRGQSVVLLEQQQLGQEASWAGAGIVPPGGDARTGTAVHRLQSGANRLWPLLSEELRERTGIDNGYFRCGGLNVADGERCAELQAQIEEWRRCGVEHELLDAAALRRVEPQIAPGTDSLVCRVPGVAQIRNPRHLKALISGCVQRGVELRTGEPVRRIHRRDGTVEGVSTTSGRLSAGQYVVAGGAWSGELLSQCGFDAGIVPVRGQIVLLATGSSPFRHIVECGPRYLVPRPDGRVLIGSTEEWVGYNKGTTSAGVQGLLQFAMGLAPSLAEARFEQSWSGLRPHAGRGTPFVGRLPECDNLLVATGHFRGGLSLSPITARLIGQLLTGEPTDFSLDELGLSPG